MLFHHRLHTYSVAIKSVCVSEEEGGEVCAIILNVINTCENFKGNGYKHRSMLVIWHEFYSCLNDLNDSCFLTF